MHHAATPLLLPNAWDVASACTLVDAGFDAIGTTSLGVAASHGVPDGRGHTRDETVAVAVRLCRLGCAVTVDVEAGFSADPGEVADLVAVLAEAGAVGINIEDGRADGLAAPEEQQALIGAVKDRVPAVFVNARVDTHWLTATPPPVEVAVRRALRYVDAGADGVFVPGVTASSDIDVLVRSIPVPVNVLYQPGQSVDRLAGLGVRRISLGSLLFRASVHAVGVAARAVRDGAALPDGIPGYREGERIIDPDQVRSSTTWQDSSAGTYR